MTIWSGPTTPRTSGYPFPVSYWGTILDIDDAGHLSVLYRWDPHSFCHFHRHFCATTSLVLDGELHVKTFENGELADTAVRRAGDYAKKPPGDVHMEQGGPRARWCCSSCMPPTAN